MTIKEVIFNIIIQVVSGIIGWTISASIIIQKNVNKNIMNNKNVEVSNGDIVNGNKK